MNATRARLGARPGRPARLLLRVARGLSVVAVLAAMACRGDKGGSNSTAPTDPTLPVRGIGNGSGSVTSVPAGINCSITSGSGSGAGCSATYSSGTFVTLTATPIKGSTFAGWFGACSGTGVCQVTMGPATRVTAFFAAPGQSFGLSILGAGTGNGSVSAAGLTCTITNGSAGPGGCAALYPAGSLVTLTATPTDGSTFAGWSGACSGTGTCQVPMTQARSVTAAFTAGGLPALIITAIGTGSGTVVSSPAGLDCTVSPTAATGSCNRTFPIGTAVTLTATQTNGSTFAGWGGACSGTGQCKVTLDQSRLVTVTFTAPVQSAARTVTGAARGAAR